MTDAYRKAYVQVLQILKHLPIEEYNKIPKEKIEFYEKNKDVNYDFTFNVNKDIASQNISREANAIIVSLFRDYFANEKQKNILIKILNRNQLEYERKLKEKYDVDNIFNKNTKR